jgi:catechol 2,3-dioxygenase-like lactoylglutathione lyase family enzyme
MTDNVSLITRIRGGTIGCIDLAATEDWYGNWLGYSVVERGDISNGLAASWGTPAMAGRPYLLMQPESGDDVYIRAAEIDPVPGYRPLTTYGWGSFEVVIEDVYALNEQLLKGPFEIIGPPQSIGPDYPTIHAMQVVGPSQECLYLTCDIGDPAESLLPPAGAAVGRDFIMVLSGLADVSIAHDFYVEKFQMTPGAPRQTSVGIITNALGLPEGEGIWMTFIPFRQPANFLEIDGYPSPAAKTRPVNDGQLPPGCAMASFGVKSLSNFDLEWLGPAAAEQSLNYAGKPSAALKGPAGEIIELIEES